MAMIQTHLAGSHLEPQMGPGSVSDSDSDSDSPGSGGGRTIADDPAGSQVIHSGHFMVSSPHSDSVPRRHHQQADPPGIDPTLTRLFECMSLAYSGKLVSPKWKNFKGLRLLCRDKIRLNNAIWRAWYIQYVEHRKSAVCGFVTPLDGSEADEHRKPEAVVLEGNYWKRRIEVVMKEYHKWRIYYKKRLHRFSREEEIPGIKREEDGWGPADNWCDQLFSNVVPMLLRDTEGEEDGLQHFDLDTFLSDISDTLFTMTQGCYPPQPSPDEAYVGNADMIQPELTPLQPNLDDFMEISDFLSSPRPLLGPPLVSYQDQPCFVPGPETLFGSSPGGDLLPAPAADSLLPPPVGPAGSPGLPSAHLQPPGGCSAPPGPPGAFLRAELSPTPPASTPASGFGLDLKAKPSAPRPFPGKWLGLDAYGPYCPAAPLPPGPPLLGPQDCPLSPAPRPKPHYPPSALFSCPGPSSGFSGPCFAPNVPSYGGMDLTSGYQLPFGSSPYLCPGGPSRPGPGPGPVRGPPQQPAVGQRPQIKGANGKTKRPLRLPGPPLVAMPNPCLTQLLTTAKPEPSPDGLPPLRPSQTSAPMEPESLPNTFCEEPAGLLPRLSGPGPRLSPSASPSPSGIAVGPSAGTAAVLVPKTERLSPSPVCGSDQKRSGQKSPVSPERLISTPFCSSTRSKNDSSKTESRRITHISAEQKRRFNIKLGFDTLHSLVSTLSAQPSLKVSKATTLQKTAEYIGKLQQERSALQDEAQRLRDQIEALNAAINLCQQQLPATGVPITRQRFDQMRSMFDEYVRSCTLQNWKFWVFSLIMRPLFESFNGMVSTSSLQSLSQTSLAWLDQYCSLPALRPTVLSSLRQLSVSTSILTNPAGIPEQAAQAVMGRGPGDVSS